jgi:murein DD-endopeptidase MepM/ murein hydrolase activator NlpD
MCSVVGGSRVRLAARCAVLAIAAAGVAGCSADAGRFSGSTPFYAARSNTPPSEVTGAVQPTHTPAYGAPVGRVESQPLAANSYGTSSSLPAPPNRYAARTPAPVQSPPPVRHASAPPAPQRAAARHAQASATHVVGRGETLITIARKYGKSRSEIARANGIKPNTHGRIGPRLTIPGAGRGVRTASAAPAQHPASAKPASAKPAPHAKPAPQAKTPKPQPQRVASLGAPPSNLKPPEERVERAHIAQPAEQAASEAKAAQPSATGAAHSFRWPVRGRVIAGFGPRPSGQQNDGINLAVPEGTSIRAAEGGVVAYAGNELKGYGNLVLVRHANGYVTAYAHASQIKVKRGDTVKRGQIIALAGQTGGVNSPQLHFEVRKGSTPVDPTPFLSNN